MYEGSAELSDGMGELKEQSDELLDEIFQIDLDNLTSFIEKEDNIRIGGAAGDVAINKTAGLAAGVLIMIIFTYVISVFVVHQIQRESSVIGTLYALGAKKKDLILHYIALPTIITFIGGLIGTCIGFSPWGMDVQTAGTCDYFSVPEFEPIYSTYLIIYGIVMPPVIAALTNALVINKRLSRTALSLIRNEQKEHSYSRVDIKSKSFIRKFQLRQIIREMRTSVTVVLGMVLSLLILMLVTDTYFLCINIGEAAENDVMYEYMYTLKYPTEDVPEGGEACYVSSLSKTENGYSLDVTVMGIDEDNPYFPTINTHAGKSSITASTAAAQRYGLKVGDKLILDDDTNEISYVFTVEEIGEYGAGLMVFMDIDSMRELFGEEEDYYNCVLSDKALDIDEGRLYSTVTKADVEKASGIILDMMQGMIVSMSVCAVVICFTVMYLMQSVMIDRAAFGISLVKTFGYRTKEVKKLYLNGNFYTAVIGAIIGIPLSKVIIDCIFPMLVSNVASGVDVAYPWQTYLLFFAGIMLIYFIVNIMLVRKLNRITPAEVLKNRE
ncbi:MAG: FtsX-like permease family protein [Oscillospiraceae bacterium]|nr:FtsX-like permease family protein [Oscillospiraceae bacterium]